MAAGGVFYYLPQSRTDATGKGIPFLGTSAKIDNVGATEDWSGEAMTFSLVSVSGPGDFCLYDVDSFGVPTVYMTTIDGIASNDVWSQTVKSGHNHHNFGFSAPGIYDITLRADGVHNTDGAKSAEATFQFQIVPEPASLALLGLSSVVLLRRRTK